MNKMLDLKHNGLNFNYLVMNNDGSDLDLNENLQDWVDIYLKIQKPYKKDDFYENITPNFINYGTNLPLFTKQNNFSNSNLNRIEQDLKTNLIDLDVGVKSIDISINKGEVSINVK